MIKLDREYIDFTQLTTFTLSYKGKYIKLSFFTGEACCEKYNFKIFWGVDKKACIYDLQAVVEENLKIMTENNTFCFTTDNNIYDFKEIHKQYLKEKQDVLNDLIGDKKVLGWKFDENSAYTLEDFDQDDDLFEEKGMTSLDIEFEDCVLIVVCENFHNGYYPHHGCVESTIARDGESDDFFEEIKFCI